MITFPKSKVSCSSNNLRDQKIQLLPCEYLKPSIIDMNKSVLPLMTKDCPLDGAQLYESYSFFTEFSEAKTFPCRYQIYKFYTYSSHMPHKLLYYQMDV